MADDYARCHHSYQSTTDKMSYVSFVVGVELDLSIGGGGQTIRCELRCRGMDGKTGQSDERIRIPDPRLSSRRATIVVTADATWRWTEYEM